ncbi:inorganic phosphate transporter, PiT family [Arthrobacter alpinus]|uniref:Inorganic phosphate transporter, PiT family n=1 Tax=Arthrobacter alpinus TaxID=656366 RepID=A0A1H5N4F4_9MICC|nr:inorganic phosphate transporter [Arthrobacter alpinus]SEE96489.1 inorganic phosphate transporter, PiT family [Arthrobacter alpinus]
MVTALLMAVIVTAAIFAFLNGFRDASTAVALSVRNRALTPSIAIILAGVFNCLGALASAVLAATFADKLFTMPPGRNGLVLLLAGLIAASLWGIYLWWRGFPSSSTHALISALVGASMGSAAIGHPPLDGINTTLLTLVLLPMLVSPLVAFVLGFVAVYPTSWMARYTAPSQVNRRTRQLQAVAGAAVAFGHGLQDGQRTTAVVLLALVAAGASGAGSIPVWLPIFTAGMLTVGTLFGGWRISYTLGHRLVRLDPMRGFVAQIVAAGLLFVGAIGLHMPLSTTHTVTAAIVGAGANQRFTATNGRILARIAVAWLATPLACVLLGAVFFLALSPLT